MPFPTVGQTLYGAWSQEGEQYADLKTRFSSLNTKLSGLVCDGVVDDRAALNTLVNVTMQPNGGQLDVAGTVRIASNITIPSNVKLNYLEGGSLSADVGVTVTIKGPCPSVLRRVFRGLGVFVLAVGLTAQVLPEWWGAVGDGANDDTVAVQAAITAASAIAPSGNPSQFGGQVYLLPGTYKITASLSVPIFVSIVGDGGSASILKASGDFDMIVFTTFADLCSVTLRDFGIVGATCPTSTAVKFLGTANAADWLSGVHFYRLRITDYQTAFRFRTLHQSTIRECWVQRCNIAVDFRGSNLTNWIERNTFVYAGGCGAGTVTGVLIAGTADYNPGGNTLLIPESIHVNSNLIYGYQIAVDLQLATWVAILDNDINATVTGLNITSCNAVLNIKYNYIEGGASVGIWCRGLAVIIQTKIVIEGNHMIGTGGGASVCGLRVNQFGVNQNQTNISIIRNSFSGWANNDIDCSNGGDITIEDNNCFSGLPGNNSIIIQSMLANHPVYIDKNRCSGNIFVSPVNNLSQIIVGANGGAFSTYIRGTITIPNGAVTATLNFAAMAAATPNFDTTANTGLKIVPRFDAPPSNLGAIWGSATATAVTINCAVAAVGNQVVPFEVRALQSNA